MRKGDMSNGKIRVGGARSRRRDNGREVVTRDQPRVIQEYSKQFLRAFGDEMQCTSLQLTPTELGEHRMQIIFFIGPSRGQRRARCCRSRRRRGRRKKGRHRGFSTNSKKKYRQGDGFDTVCPRRVGGTSGGDQSLLLLRVHLHLQA
jgi:hypothetical protein